MASIRIARVASELQRNLSLLLRDGLRGEELPAMVSVTHVEVTNDLKYAKVALGIYGGDEAARTTFERIEGAAKYLRHELATRMSHMHAMPELHFKRDTSQEYGARIDEILRKLHEEEQ